MKKGYNILEISVVMFETEDIITSSSLMDKALESEMQRNPDLDFSELFGK